MFWFSTETSTFQGSFVFARKTLRPAAKMSRCASRSHLGKLFSDSSCLCPFFFFVVFWHLKISEHALGDSWWLLILLFLWWWNLETILTFWESEWYTPRLVCSTLHRFHQFFRLWRVSSSGRQEVVPFLVVGLDIIPWIFFWNRIKRNNANNTTNNLTCNSCSDRLQFAKNSLFAYCVCRELAGTKQLICQLGSKKYHSMSSPVFIPFHHFTKNGIHMW